MELELSVYVDANTWQTNPGPCAVGVVIVAGRRALARHGKYIGRTTSNVGEWSAVIEGLKTALNLQEWPDVRSITIYSDSQLVVNQANGCWQVHHPRLATLADEWTTVLSTVPRSIPVRLKWARRNYKEGAHEVSLEALDEAMERHL